jgi:peroxiredoxin Q/BCP
MAKKATTTATKKAANKTARKATKASDRTATAAGTATSGAGAKAATKPASAKSLLSEGRPAPAFRLPRDGGGTVTRADYDGRKLVIFFYPRADTPGCTREAIDFSRLSSDFTASGTAVLGVSADPPAKQESFRDKHALSVPLGSDETHEMLERYGVWGKKTLYGKTFDGIIRTTVLIGADGRVARIWRNVKVEGHAEAVLAAARALPD